MKNSTQLLAASLLALGVCALVSPGCGKASAPKNEVTLAEMNEVMSMMATWPMGAPRTVDALKKVPAFKGPAFKDRPFPSPPAGKKFIIDRSTGKVIIGGK